MVSGRNSGAWSSNGLMIAAVACVMTWMAWTAWNHTARVDELSSREGQKLIVDMQINVNSANAAELVLLPGIGSQLALNIIDDRERNGPFASLAELTRVRGIGPATVDRISTFAVAEHP